MGEGFGFWFMVWSLGFEFRVYKVQNGFRFCVLGFLSAIFVRQGVQAASYGL